MSIQPGTADVTPDAGSTRAEPGAGRAASPGEADLRARLEAVDDLAHDLGRHIRLPLALLPIDAPADAVRAALERGVFRTRTDRRGTWSAEDLLDAFEAALPVGLGPDVAPVRAAVAAAVALLAAPADTLQREEAHVRLAAVGAAIAALRGRWEGAR